jgi:copper(I)-binding protein
MKALLFAGAVTLVAATAAIAQGYRAGPLSIDGPWSRPTPVGATTGAGYLTITNHGASEDRLIGASTPAAARVEIHEMSMDGGVMRMRKVSGGLAIPAGEAVTLSPGGYHVMFIGLKAPFAPGDRIPTTLRFQKAGAVEVSFDVNPSGPGRRSH